MRERNWSTSPVEESFGGIITPLTFSFMREHFAHSYRAIAKILGVPDKLALRHSFDFERMLGYMHGVVWFDFNAFMELLAMTPGYALNQKRTLELLGLPTEWAPTSRDTYPFRYLRAWWSRRRLSLASSRYELKYRKWIAATELTLSNIAPMRDVGALDADQLVERLEQIQTLMENDWVIPSLNDFACSIVGGKLDARVRHTKPEIAEQARIVGEAAITDFSAPTAQLVQRAHAMTKHDNPETVADHWLELYGHRSFRELHLDAPIFMDNREAIVERVKSVASAEAPSWFGAATAAATSEPATTAVPVDSNDGDTLTLISQLRLLSTTREAMRGTRAELFARARLLIRELGLRFESEGVLSHAELIQGLELNELIGFVRGTSTTSNLQAIAKLRLEPLQQESESQPVEATNVTELVGIAASPGTATAEARVVLDPSKAGDLVGNIMVCEMTDPGWTLLFPGCAAIVTERGNVLSHTAIVARELGIPTVVGVADATKLLANGSILTVDGGRGTISCNPGDTSPD